MNKTTAQSGFAPLVILLVLLVLAALGVVGYFAYTKLVTPVQIKEKVSVLHSAYSSYNENLKKIVDHLKDDGATDSDAIDRSNEKGKSLLVLIEKDQKLLENNLSTLSFSETKSYKDYLTDYLAKAKEIVTHESDSVRIGEEYSQVLRDYEKLTVSISGVSMYMYSDPDRYISSIEDGIKKEEEIIKDVNKIGVSGLWKEYNDLFAKKLQIEVDYLEQVKAAVENRRSSDMAPATKKYTEAMQDASKDISRVAEKIDDKTKNLEVELSTLSVKIDSEYNSLRSRFNF